MSTGADRPRDDRGRPQSDRRRDRLGRPLPPDAPDASAVPRESEDVVRTPAQTVARAQELLDAGLPFNAHDVLEAAWKHGPPAERDLWQGLAQLCVAVTHAERGNPDGASRLAARGAARLTAYAEAGGDPHGVDVDRVLGWAGRADLAEPLRLRA